MTDYLKALATTEAAKANSQTVSEYLQRRKIQIRRTTSFDRSTLPLSRALYARVC
jgi:hypothetical protein